MKNHFYILILLLLFTILLGCQSGSTSFPQNFNISSSNIKITGTVTVTGTSTPVDQAKITVYPNGNTVITNISGKFEDIIPDGQTLIKVEKKGYETETTPIVSGQTDYLISLTKGGLTYSGTIQNASLSPVASANLELQSLSNEFNSFSTLSDFSGNFSFTELPADDYLLTITKTNYANFTKNISLTANTVETLTLSSNVSTLYNIKGNIFKETLDSDEVRTAVSGATIELLLLNNSLYENQKTLTDSSGEYLLQGIPNGNYKILVKKDNFLNYEKLIEVSFSDLEVENISISQSASTVITGSTYEIEFVLTDADTEQALNGVIISFDNNNGITDQNGISTFEVVSGNYNVTFEKGGYKRQTRNINVSQSKTYNIPLIYDLVGNLGTIKGRISRSDDAAFTDDVVVSATLNTQTTGELNEDIVITTVANDNDEYIFTNLQVLYNPDGKEYKYVLQAWYDFNSDDIADTNEVSYQIVDLEAGKTSIADIMLIVP